MAICKIVLTINYKENCGYNEPESWDWHKIVDDGEYVQLISVARDRDAEMAEIQLKNRK